MLTSVLVCVCRLSWPGSDFVFDIASGRIQLSQYKPGDPSQHWHYTRCAEQEAPRPVKEEPHEVQAASSRAFSPPATTETVSVTEEKDFVITTRTTTTTVITTVTEITRMPKALFLAQGQQGGQRRSIAYQ